MTARLTTLLFLSLTTIAISAPAVPIDPNNTTTELSFERKDDVATWSIDTVVDGQLITYRNPGSIRPKYAAKIFLRRPESRGCMISSDKEAVTLALKSPLAQQLSQAQKDFLAQGFGALLNTSRTNIANHYAVDFYAVGEEDAKIMARALLDERTEYAHQCVASEKDTLKECQGRVKHNRGVLPEKERHLEQAEKGYRTAKSSTYPLNREEEAATLAKELVLQMDRQAKTLDIDRAEARGKLDVIDQYLSQALTNNIIEKLEAQKIELMVELSGLEARREAIRKIRDEQQRFCTLFQAREELVDAVKRLKETLKRDEEVIQRITDRLKNPPEYMQPPKVYQNKVFIYPIEEVDSHN